MKFKKKKKKGKEQNHTTEIYINIRKAGKDENVKIKRSPFSFTRWPWLMHIP